MGVRECNLASKHAYIHAHRHRCRLGRLQINSQLSLDLRGELHTLSHGNLNRLSLRPQMAQLVHPRSFGRFDRLVVLQALCANHLSVRLRFQLVREDEVARGPEELILR